ncbi:MAG: class I SAM-dependent methyltransferase [Proteobacteria bacterium]|nr:MAG: class I SAM-dependent methyltransferase [Pseudomonadota bacterium]
MPPERGKRNAAAKIYYADLPESAATSLRHSWRCCHNGIYGGVDCAWYHGVWQYFSLLNLVSTPWDQFEFYDAEIRHLPRRGKPLRILVSGAADHAMLAVVSTALCDRAPHAKFTVVDVCPTPLLANRRFAKKTGLSVETVRADIVAYGEPSTFDAIFSHSFLGNFDEENRPRLIEAWHRLLKPRGRVIMINRVRPAADTPTQFSPETANLFVDRVAAAAKAAGQLKGTDTESLARRARTYVERYRSHPVTNLRQLLEQFENGGFDVRHGSAEEGSPAGSGPTTTGAAGRFRFILQSNQATTRSDALA